MLRGMRRVVLGVMCAVLLLLPVVGSAATVTSPWERTIAGVATDVLVNALAADAARVYAALQNNEDYQISAIRAPDGTTAWTKTKNQAGDLDAALAVNVAFVRALGAGFVTTGGPSEDRYIRLYSSVNGRVLCQRKYGPGGTDDRFLATAQTSTRLAGGGFKGDDWVVNVLDTDCDPVAQKVIGSLGIPGQVNAMAANFTRFAAAGKTDDGTNTVYTVAVYNHSTGAEVWRIDRASPGVDNEARDVAIDSARVYSAGVVQNHERAYIEVSDVGTGGTVWSVADLPLGGYERSEYNALAVKGGVLVAVGFARSAGAATKDLLVTARDAVSGALLWQDVVDVNGAEDEATAVAMAGGFVIVVGFSDDGANNDEMIVRIYTAAGDGGAPVLVDDGGAFLNPGTFNGGPDSRGTAAAGTDLNLDEGQLARLYAGGNRGTAGSLDGFIKSYLITE